eukprot:TRINITY_DN419_c0_g1_i1.p1 TRINITY_DN419_c0_g1~~TRINITY_DN419_c0_g1_i1.p1  ORF type:complete len:1282 (-),score=132.08 TRINITY_DN419_c0_g1_i1:6940-10785(-)
MGLSLHHLSFQFIGCNIFQYSLILYFPQMGQQIKRIIQQSKMEYEESPFSSLMNILACILGVDDKKRAWAEQQLSLIRSQDPDQLLLTLVKIIRSDSSRLEFAQYRKIAAILIQKYVSTTSGTNLAEKTVWCNLSEETQTWVKAGLLSSLEAETNPSMARTLAHTVAELDSTLQDYNEEWPEVCSLIDRLISPSEPQLPMQAVMKEIGYVLLNEVFGYRADYYEAKLGELLVCFKHTLERDLMPTKIACIEALCSAFYSLEDLPEECFTELLVRITNCMRHCLHQRDEVGLSKIIEALSMVADSEPKLFRNDFEDLLLICAAIAMQPVVFEREELREMALELVLEVFDRVPSQTLRGSRTPEAYFDDAFKATLYVMRLVPLEIDEDWLKPVDLPYYDYDPTNDIDDYNINFGRQAIDRLLSSTKAEIGLNILGSTLLAYFSAADDWRYRYAALMAVSQVGAYVRNPATLSTLIPLVLNHVTMVPNPKVKHAGLVCLAQLSKDSDAAFQSTYHDKVIPALVAALEVPLPRVQQQACFSLKAFIAKLSKESMELYIEGLMGKLSKIVEPDSLIQLQESAISVIGHISAAAPEMFKRQYYDQVMAFVLERLKRCKEAKYKALKGNIIECITLMSKSVGREKLAIYLKTVIEAFYQVQEHELDKEGFLRSALLNAWQSLCIISKEDLLPYTETLVPSLLKLCESVPGVAVGKVKPSSKELAKTLAEAGILPAIENKSDGKKIKNHPEEIDKEDAVSLAFLLVDTFGTKLGKYLDNCASVFLNALQYSSQESLKKTSAIALKAILLVAKEIKGDFAYLLPIIKLYLQTLLQAAQNETDPENIETEARIMQEILLETGLTCMEQKELLKFLEQVMNLVSGSNRRKIANNSVKESQSLDDVDLKILSEDNEKEDRLQLTLANLLGAIFKTHKDESVVFVPVLYPDLISEMLKFIATPVQKAFALTLCVKMLEHLTFSRIPTIYPSLCDIVISYSNEPNPTIRKIALYGIGAITYSAGEYFGTIAENLYCALRQAVDAPIPEKVNRKEWRMAQENGVASLGKLIFYQGKAYVEHLPELIAYWLKRLPIRVDAKEGKGQCDLLAELLETDCIMTVGSSGENMGELLRILCEVLETDQVSPTCATNISKGLNRLGSIPEYYTKMIAIAEGLPVEHKDKLANNIKLRQINNKSMQQHCCYVQSLCNNVHELLLNVEYNTLLIYPQSSSQLSLPPLNSAPQSYFVKIKSYSDNKFAKELCSGALDFSISIYFIIHCANKSCNEDISFCFRTSS